MAVDPSSHQILRRYLTLFYSFTLGLAVFLAILASYQRGNKVPSTTDLMPTATVQSISPTLKSIQAHSGDTPTPLPAIPPTPNEATPSALGLVAAQLSGVRVSLWHPWTGIMGAALQAILDEFNRTNRWGITVQASAYEGFASLDQAVNSALVSDSLPEVMVDYGFQARSWDINSTFVDLIPYVDDPVWGMQGVEQSDFYPAFWAEDLFTKTSFSQSQRLGIPFYRSANVLFYNQSWARELGYLNPPTSVEDFRSQACVAAGSITQQGDKTNQGKGGWLVSPQPGAAIGWIYAFGGNFIQSNGQGYLFNTPETDQAFEYLKALYKSGCAWSEADVNPPYEFATRQALFLVSNLFDIPTQQQAFDQAGNADEWLVIPFPSDTAPVVATYGPSLLLTHSNPVRQLAAWLVIKWLVYPPNQAEWVRTLEAYPTRKSTLNYLGDTVGNNPQWLEALKLLPDARSEPAIPSWSVMRWALNDAMTQLLDPQFEADQIPILLENLDSTATEIFTQVR